MPTIRLEDVSKSYASEHRHKMVVHGINLTIEQGDFVFVIGSSGAGKTTLLKLICGLTKPDRGTVYFNDADLNRAVLLSRDRIRRQVGYVSQEPLLMHRRTIMENLTMVVCSKGLFRTGQAREMAEKVLGIVGLNDVEKKYPGELSGGERRRVELARALINSPPILVLDELTANLDEDHIWDMFHLLSELNRQGTTVIMATHASMFVNLMRQRVITLVDGEIVSDVAKGKYGDVVLPKADRWPF